MSCRTGRAQGACTSRSCSMPCCKAACKAETPQSTVHNILHPESSNLPSMIMCSRPTVLKLIVLGQNNARTVSGWQLNHNSACVMPFSRFTRI